MKNKVEQYLFVYDEQEGLFPERWKVVDNDDKSVVAADINGHIKKHKLDSLRKALKQRYSDKRFVITSAYGNTWGAIQNNYRGMFYEHFSQKETNRGADAVAKNELKQEKIPQKTDSTHSLPFSTKINTATQQGSFFILFLVAYGVYWGWNEYLMIKSLGSTFSWLYQLVFYQPYHLLVSIHIPVFTGIAIYYLFYFSYQLLSQIIVNQDGMTLKPGNKFTPWSEIKEIYISKISEKYDEMSLFGNCLTLFTNSGQRIALSNRFENLATLVNVIKNQIEQPVIDSMLMSIEQNGYFKFSNFLSVSANELMISSTSKQINVDLKRISHVAIVKEELEIYNLENKLIYKEDIQSVKNSIFMETLIQKLTHKFKPNYYGDA